MIKLNQYFKLFVILLTTVVVICILAAIIYYFTQSYPKGAVVTNGKNCAEIGSSILNKKGTAVDAAIAALLCEGISMPQSMGIGGGFLMTIYIKNSSEIISLNAREMAPSQASEDMFHGDSNLSTKGGLAIAIPGELKGYWAAYEKYGGGVPWKELFQPTIKLCREGIPVTSYLAGIFAQKRDELYKDPSMREVFIDPATNDTYKAGKNIKRLRLAKTLELVAENGINILYNGSLTENFAKDIQAAGGIITPEDLNNYRAEFQESIKVFLPSNQTLYTVPLPGSGVILAYIMNILGGFLDHSKPNSVVNWQRIIESFKFGYGKRTLLGDMDFLNIGDLVANLTSAYYGHETRNSIYDNKTFQEPEYYGASTTFVEDYGTAHISVLAPNGDAVSVTSTINLYFGSGVMSASTGIILNDQMDDFSSPNMTNDYDIPPSIANYIVPGKRPLSSMTPSIIIDDVSGDVRMIVGAAGGTKITTSVAQIIMKHLWFNMTIEDAIYDKRLHHQLFPMNVDFEKDYDKDMSFVNALHKIGHEYKISETNGFSAATGISKIGGVIEMSYDKRRCGEVVYVY